VAELPGPPLSDFIVCSQNYKLDLVVTKIHEMEMQKTWLLAGIPAVQKNLYHRIQFSVGDPAAWIQFQNPDKSLESLLICRDIEMGRARKKATVDAVYCPADFTPATGLSGDRETATAQAVAECLTRRGISSVISDRSLSLIYLDALKKVNIDVQYSSEMGVMERRAKSSDELVALKQAQSITEKVMTLACQLVCKAKARPDGTLEANGASLSSESLKACIDHWLLDEGFSNPGSIVACGPQGADCHEYGSGPLYTESPIIIDIFPCSKTTYYNGDCTRTAVHGKIPAHIENAYETVVKAKFAAMKVTQAGVTGEAVHQETIRVIHEHGYETGLPSKESPENRCAMVHGTGHGVGLEVHEPPLLDFKGPELIVGDVLTIEPGLYCPAWGGVRSEDMVAVLENDCVSYNQLPDTLKW
jgi:Xaa-Pro aminopeptidase